MNVYRCQHHDALVEISKEFARQAAEAEAMIERLREQMRDLEWRARKWDDTAFLFEPYRGYGFTWRGQRPELPEGRKEDSANSRELCVIIHTDDGDAVHHPMTEHGAHVRRPRARVGNPK